MGHSWIAPTLLIGMATHSCVAFVPTFLEGVSNPAATSSTIEASTSGVIGLGSHVSRSTHSSSTHSSSSLRWRAGYAGPLMMAKARKKGKGKAGRVELIERCAIEGVAREVLSGTGSEIKSCSAVSSTWYSVLGTHSTQSVYIFGLSTTILL